MAQTTTVAKPDLDAATFDQYFDANYDERKLFLHSVSLFYLSYPEAFPEDDETQDYVHIDLFKEKEEEYLQITGRLTNVDITDRSWRQPIWDKCLSRSYNMLFAVKAFKGRNLSRRLSYIITNLNTGIQLGSVQLSHRREQQSFRCKFTNCSFEDMIDIRRENHRFQIEVEAEAWDESVVDQPLNVFTIGFGNIHPEGFQQWFDFGRGVNLLIEISYIVEADPDDDSSNFHIQMIARMIEWKLTHGLGVTWHKNRAGQAKVSCMRPQVEPDSHRMYWRTTEDRLSEVLRDFAESYSDQDSDTKRPPVIDSAEQFVPYFDLQRSLIYSEDIEETVCLCNEWCNWSAFFHYNPIFRFIVVMNSQLFITNHFNRSEIYIFCGVIKVMTYGGSAPNKRAGFVIRLIHSANQYREIHYHNYRKRQNVHDLYLNSEPNPVELAASSYRHLRYDTFMPDLMLETESNQLSDIGVQNLIYYYKVLESLHFFVGEWTDFLDQTPDNVREWQKEYNAISQAQVEEFLKAGISVLFRADTFPDPRGGPNPLKIDFTDRVFRPDEEYIEYYPKSDDEMQIKYLRLKGFGSFYNVLNVKVTLKRFIYSFVCVYRFFVRIDRNLTKPEEKNAFIDANDSCVRFDRKFGRKHKPEPPSKFVISAEDLAANQLPAEKRLNLMVFFTLKLYSFDWFLQKSCVMARSGVLDYEARRRTQIADQFVFVFNHLVIEETLLNTFNISLFTITNRLEELFSDFYDNFWGQPLHEEHSYDINTQPLSEFAESAVQQYNKLFVWSTLGGYNRAKFSAILEQFRDDLSGIHNQNVDIFDDRISPEMEWLLADRGYEFVEEVVDVLVHYLCRATCFCLTKVVATLFRVMHGLQNYPHCRNDVAYSLGKPGWTEIFVTLEEFVRVFDQLRDIYLFFDDEMERIFQTFSDTQIMIKKFYQFFYTKLSWEWHREVVRIANQVNNPALTAQQIQLFNDLMVLETVVGIAFSVRFANHFRFGFNSLRRDMFRIHDLVINFQAPHNYHRFATCLPTVRQYMADPMAVRTARPFESNHWSNYLNQLIPDLMALTAQGVGLDMNEADRVIVL